MKRDLRKVAVKGMNEKYHNFQAELERKVFQREFSLEQHTDTDRVESGRQTVLGQDLIYLETTTE